MASRDSRDEAVAPVHLPQLRATRADIGDLSVFRELIGIFLVDAPEHVETVRRAAAVGDADAVKLAAHTLKGSSGYVGARGLVRICQELEDATGSAPPPPALVAQLEAELARVRVVLERELRENAP